MPPAALTPPITMSSSSGAVPPASRSPPGYAAPGSATSPCWSRPRRTGTSRCGRWSAAGRPRCAPRCGPRRNVMPPGVRWLRGRAAAVDPAARTVTTASGRVLSYGRLVLAPGLRLDWDGVPGLAAALGHDGVTSNYRPDLAPHTWELIRRMRRGTGRLHDAVGAGQVRRRPAEDRVSGGRPLAQARCAGRDPHHPGAPRTGDVQGPGVLPGAGGDRPALRHRGAPAVGDDRARRRDSARR